MKILDSKILSSCYLNFLFGAGVNGSSFPQLAQFKKTNDFLRMRIENHNGKSFEELFDSLETSEKIEARKIFIDEFKTSEKKIDLANPSIINIRDLLMATYKLVYDSENRIKGMKQINIFTANYDFIVEECIKDLGYLCNYISASNLKSRDRFFSIVGHDFYLNREVPTFLVSKIHGDISDPVLPGVEKFNSVLEPNKFEIVFKMKEKLSRDNSVLFVIGYSGRDEHINRILKDCVESRLTIYWLKYKSTDVVPDALKERIHLIENDNGGDTTAFLAEKMRELWEESSEK